MANIKQIAELSGVSVATVSRVLNNHAYVSENKRHAVLSAIEKLNYSRNMNAFHLVKGKTNMIGIMLPMINHVYFSRLVEGISHEALRNNYQLVLCQTGYKIEKEIEILDLLKTKQLDGIIICSKTLDWKDIEPYTQYGPILVCEHSGSAAISSVYMDHYACFKLALNYLIKKGHKHLGFCVGRENSESTRQRKKAYLEAVHSLGEAVCEEWMFYHCYNIASGAEVVHKMLRMERRPSALLVAGDHVAAGIIMELKKQRLQVPQDLAVIGFDNQPIAEIFDLTTIDNQLFEMGGSAFRVIHDQITQKTAAPESREIAFRLLERSTV